MFVFGFVKKVNRGQRPTLSRRNGGAKPLFASGFKQVN